MKLIKPKTNLTNASIITTLFFSIVFTLISYIYYGLFNLSFVILLIGTIALMYLVYRQGFSYFKQNPERLSINVIVVLIAFVLLVGLTTGTANKTAVNYFKDQDVLYLIDRSFILMYLPAILLTGSIVLLGQKHIKSSVFMFGLTMIVFVLSLNNMYLIKMDGSIIRQNYFPHKEKMYELKDINQISVSSQAHQKSYYKYIVETDDFKLDLFKSSVSIQDIFETRYGDFVFLDNVYKENGIKKVIVDKGSCYYDDDICANLDKLLIP